MSLRKSLNDQLVNRVENRNIEQQGIADERKAVGKGIQTRPDRQTIDQEPRFSLNKSDITYIPG